MSKKSRNKYGSIGSWDGLNLDPFKVNIAEDDHKHPRHTLHESRRRVSRRLVNSIKKNGVLVPICVYLDGDEPTVAAGRRRIRHARVAARELFEEGKVTEEDPFLVRAFSVKDPIAAEQIENSFRQRESPIAQARFIAESIGKNLYTEEEAFALLGLTKRKGDRLLLLLTATPEIQERVNALKMPVDVALKLIAKGSKKQREFLAKADAGEVPVAGDAGLIAARNIDGAPRNVRPRCFFAQAAAIEAPPSVPPEVIAWHRFMTGHDDALDAFPALTAFAMNAGWDPAKRRCRRLPGVIAAEAPNSEHAELPAAEDEEDDEV